jgi:hypothetical protein
MSNLKISALTSATTPLAGTEVLPIVQSSTTKQVSIANLTAGRTQTSNGIVQGTAATGYNFSANTPAAGMTSQLLNWYEEGTWTPAVSGVSLTTPLGTYIKIGRKVFANFTFASTATVSASSFLISGLPFTPNVSATEADRPAGYLTYNPGVKSWTLLFGSGSSSVAFRQDPGGTSGTITELSGQTLWGTIIYTSV